LDGLAQCDGLADFEHQRAAPSRVFVDDFCRHLMPEGEVIRAERRSQIGRNRGTYAHE
jgi:hypothetical protein